MIECLSFGIVNRFYRSRDGNPSTEEPLLEWSLGRVTGRSQLSHLEFSVAPPALPCDLVLLCDQFLGWRLSLCLPTQSLLGIPSPLSWLPDCYCIIPLQMKVDQIFMLGTRIWTLYCFVSLTWCVWEDDERHPWEPSSMVAPQSWDL